METARQMAWEQNDKMAAIISVFTGCTDPLNTFILQFWIFVKNTHWEHKKKGLFHGRDSNSTPNVERERERNKNQLEVIYFQWELAICSDMRDGGHWQRYVGRPAIQQIWDG